MLARIDAELKVRPLPPQDAFKDMLRLAQADRGPLRNGSVCVVQANGLTKRMVVRAFGDPDRDETQSGDILLDEITRKFLGVTIDGLCRFAIAEAGPWERVKWALSVPYRGNKVSAWIGIVSLAIGLFGILLAVTGILIAVSAIL